MTKKFWKDWENRVGYTKNIYLFYYYPKYKKVNGGFELYNAKIIDQCGLLNREDRIIDAKFNKDSVDLTIERHREIFNVNGNHWHIQNEKITLKRENIAKIEFQK